MSSTYRPVCLNHDPALLVDAEWSHLDPVIEAVTGPAEARDGSPLRDHAGCDLVIGRWSGALIQIICPPPHLRVAAPHQRHHQPQTVDVEWLSLLGAAGAHADLTDLLGWIRRRNSCWHQQRLARLDWLLEMETVRG